MEKVVIKKDAVVMGSYDVVVVGGGIAGISAALSARRNNSSVLLIEKEYSLGGLATLGLVTVYLPIDDGCGNKIISSIGEELLKLSISHGSEVPLSSAWEKELNNQKTKSEERKEKRCEARFNAPLFSILVEQLLIKEGVNILYGSYVTGAITKNNKIKEIVVENKSGTIIYNAKAFVDASGDADLFKFSNALYEDNKKGNILASWYYYGDCSSLNNLKPLGFCDSVLKEDTVVDIDTKTRYSGLSGLDNTNEMIASHYYVLNDFLKNGELNEKHTLNSIASIPQNRMTRKIIAPTILDIFEKKHYSDSVGIFPNWRKWGPVYELPYSALYSVNICNLISAGRIISVTDDSWDITRVIPVCALSGEAAGVAASLIKTSFKNVPIRNIQSILKKRGIKLSL